MKSPRTSRDKKKAALRKLNHHKYYDRPTAVPNQETWIRTYMSHSTLPKVHWTPPQGQVAVVVAQ